MNQPIDKEIEVVVKEMSDELWELLPPNFNYGGVDRKSGYNWLKTRLEYSLTTISQKAREEERERIFKYGRKWFEDNFKWGKTMDSSHITEHQFEQFLQTLKDN